MTPFRACSLLPLAALSMASMSSAFVVTPAALPSYASRQTVGAISSLSGSQRHHPHTTAVSMGLADIVPGPLKSVFASKPKSSSSRRTRTEGAEMYRTLGVTPDADYMEVLDACDKLKEKYAGDRKQMIKLDKAKDDIMALRLTQAVAGNIKTTEEAKDMDSYMTAKDEYMKKKNSAFRVPDWARGWFMVPDETHIKQVAYRHGLFAAFAACFPSATMGLQALGGASNFALTMNRGAPDLKRDDNNQIAEIRLPAKKTLALSLVTMCLSHVLGSFLGKVCCVTFGEYYLMRESWEGMFIQLAFLTSGLFISTWRDPEDGPKTARRRGKGSRKD